MIGVLPKKAIEHEEKRGRIVLKGRGAVNATSIDLKVDRLFKHRNFDRFTANSFEDYFQEVKPKNGKWVLLPYEFYAAESVEYLHKEPRYTWDVSSRSRWARIGVRCESLKHDDESPFSFYDGRLRFTVKTMGTSVVLRKTDSPAQVRFAREGFLPIFEGPELTLDKKIKLYTGGVIDPSENIDNHFEEIDVSNGFNVDRHAFYLSASREWVKIPNDKIGYLHGTDYSGQLSGAIKPVGIATQMIHCNAPYIDPYPCFEGKVAFENYPFLPVRIKEGIPLVRLEMMPLLIRYRQGNEAASSFNGQNDARISPE
jgi:deoxycytidine triphosphate deaminase